MKRRDFIQGGMVAASTILAPNFLKARAASSSAVGLPAGTAPPALTLSHFPDRLHAFVWRNWPLVPLERMAKVLAARPEEIRSIGKSMGLGRAPRVTTDQLRRSYLTIIRRNWHLLPYEQLLDLLGWTADQLAFTLREDDFLFVKLGNLKPTCQPLRYARPDGSAKKRAAEIAELFRQDFPDGATEPTEALFAFVPELSKKTSQAKRPRSGSQVSPRFCYSYFALYGDPFLDRSANPYPDGYLARLAESGVDGVWLQAVLYKLAVLPWEKSWSAQHEARLENLGKLIDRAKREGLKVFLYLNEPRAMPLEFFRDRPELRGVVEGQHATLCTSVPEVREYLSAAIRSICQAAPGLGGFFSISASENLTNCWSHQAGAQCPRCRTRLPSEVIAEVISAFRQGIDRAKSSAELIAWDWGWPEAWAEQIIQRLPKNVALMSVSEWDIPIERGGVKSVVGEYSISVVGPGPRARKHWGLAKQRGLKVLAKMQAGNTWEISAVPYIPALENVAQHAANLHGAGVNGVMLGWTLGGYPSPNLEVVSEVLDQPIDAGPIRATAAEATIVDTALLRVAERRFGTQLAAAVVEAWRNFSRAFKEFPFDGGLVYFAPLQLGPANLLWEKPTGYTATMVGFPYDDLDRWRGVYPPKIFIGQFKKMAVAFEAEIEKLKRAAERSALSKEQGRALSSELNVAEVCAIHFRSVANQARFVEIRRAAASAKRTAGESRSLEEILHSEIELARRLHAIQSRDSRIGFEASNQYYYVPIDLAEKVLNCRELLKRFGLR